MIPAMTRKRWCERTRKTPGSLTCSAPGYSSAHSMRKRCTGKRVCLGAALLGGGSSSMVPCEETWAMMRSTSTWSRDSSATNEASTRSSAPRRTPSPQRAARSQGPPGELSGCRGTRSVPASYSSASASTPSPTTLQAPSRKARLSRESGPRRGCTCPRTFSVTSLYVSEVGSISSMSSLPREGVSTTRSSSTKSLPKQAV
mmetsp:Transcript_94292/g.266731  ORF Transcript_94292/g.266731 Transcript_94292/m.266731 type:complete len:201 (+) Transcript_94292:1218-1820(+)